MSLFSAELIEAVTDHGGGSEWHPVHWVCMCNEDIAFCGEELTGDFTEGAPDEEQCIVCVELKDLPCPRCGDKTE